MREAGADRWRRALVDTAYEVAGRMRRRMEDDLDACDYDAEEVKTVMDLAKFGHCVVKGPFPERRERVRYVRDDKAGRLRQQRKPDLRPRFQRIPVWDFFCDPDALSFDDAEDCLELHRLSRSLLREYARTRGWDPAAVRALLRTEPGPGRRLRQRDPRTQGCGRARRLT